MQELSQEQIQAKFKDLPEDLQGAMFSEENANILMAIGKKYNLPIDKIGELNSLVNYIILGVMGPKEFIPNVAKKLGLDKETAKKIAEEINSQIFSKIRDSLKKLHKVPADAEAMAGKEDKKSEPALEKEIPEKKVEEKPRPPQKVPEMITPQSTPFEKKITDENFRVEKEETEKKEEAKTPSFAEMKKDIKKQVDQARQEKKYPTEADPYREPIE